MKKVRNYLYESILKINEEILDSVSINIKKGELDNGLCKQAVEDYKTLNLILSESDVDDLQKINNEMVEEIEKQFFQKFDKTEEFFKEQKLNLVLFKRFGKRELILRKSIS